MGKVQQRILIAAALLAFGPAEELWARKFYNDDPLQQMPPPLHVDKLKRRKLNDIYDFFLNTFAKPGDHSTPARAIPSQAVNTLGEVTDNAWFTNRHGVKPLSTAELQRGPGSDHAPSLDKPLRVVAAKTEGITPGLTVEDSKGRKYLIKFDPKSNPEMATAVDVVGCKFFYAIGYNTPENYIIYFKRSQLEVAREAKVKDREGKDRPMNSRDVEDLLQKVPLDSQGRYRAVASYFLKGDLIGPFRYHGTRTDDPNDIVPHEHRRDLRGLAVFASWLNHSDSKSLNSLDSIVEENGLRYVKHYLVDFGAILGSDSFEAKSPRAGNVYLFDWNAAANQFFSFGLYAPKWMRAHYPHIPSVGHFEYETFQPEKWRSNYQNPAFRNRSPGDDYWGAKIVMSFRDRDIRTLVESGQYTDPRAVDWLTDCLIERRNRIGAAFLTQVLAFDHFRIEGGRLAFDDLASANGFVPARGYTVQWSHFDNDAERKTPIAGRTGIDLPPELSAASVGSYFAADIQSGDPKKTVTVYLRKTASGAGIAGIDRTW